MVYWVPRLQFSDDHRSSIASPGAAAFRVRSASRNPAMIDIPVLHFEPNVLVVIGLAIIAAFLGGKVVKGLGIPQVVGWILAGFVLGESFLKVIPLELVDQLSFVSVVALGLIGFDIGSHLRLGELRKLGRSIVFILLGESLSAFFLVAAGVYLLTQSWHAALVFGAVAAATDPASTVEVLAEYDANHEPAGRGGHGRRAGAAGL